MAELLSPAQLVEAVRAEQCARWQHGEPIRAEAILDQYPALRDDADWVLQVIYQEILLREERGEIPQLEEYLSRFPRFASELRPLFAVHRVLEANSLSGSGVSTPADRASRSGPTVPDPDRPAVPGYEILERLGRGGMGVVYRARQVRLDREVALKMISAGAHADAAERNRFQAEARAQAHLQHPHVVQVFEVGESAGCPYLALELVEGGSLAQQLGGRPQAPRPAAQLVEMLARAVHHAHERGLVHRDLKPANILLARAPKAERRTPNAADEVAPDLGVGISDFTPKVTDFGLAKWLQGGAGPSSSGAVVGTPSYMAPEQASGRTKEVGPPADVYALGAILYEMLTGRPPFLGATALDTLLQVRTQEPVPPRRLQPQVPRDLETICLKCLDKEPGRRYPSAAALADDLGRFLRGETTRARPTGPVRRLGRWGRRKPLLAGLAAGLVVAVVGGFAGVTWQWLRADRLRGEAETNLEESERQRKRAVAAEARAQHRFQELRALAGVFMYDFYDKIADLPGATPVREFLVKTALTYLDKLAQETGDDPELLKELVTAYARVGDVQGNSMVSHRGDTKAALANYRKALALANTLVETHPDDAQGQRLLSMCHERLGDIHMEHGQSQEALPSFQRFLELTQKLAQAAPNDARAQRDLSVSHMKMASALADLGRRPEALANYQSCLAHFQALARSHPNDAKAQRDMFVSYLNVGDVQRALGQAAEALANYQHALEVAQALAKNDPASTLAQRDLSMAYMRIGQARQALDQHEEALAIFLQGLPISETLAKADANDARARRDRSMYYMLVGDEQVDLGQHAEALANYRRCVELDQLQLKANPDNPRAQRDLSVSYSKVCDTQRALGQKAEAVASCRHCLDLDQALAKAYPNDAEAQHHLATTYHRLGILYAEADQLPEALASHRQSLALRETLARAAPTSAEAQRDLAISYLLIGDTQEALGQWAEALCSYRQGLPLWEQLAQAAPANTRAQRELAISYMKVGDADVALGHSAEALASYQHCVDLDQALAKAAPNDARAQRDLAIDYVKVGDAQLALGQKAEALASYRHSLELRQVLAKAAPDNTQAQRELSIGYLKVGDARWALGQTTEALANYQQCLEIDQARAKAQPDNSQTQYDLGVTYGTLGNLHDGIASDAAQTRADRITHGRKALEWFTRSLTQFSSLHQRGLLRADQVHLLDDLSAQIDACEMALCQLEAEDSPPPG
jgi:serine/threonine protein kinase/tetratricopeptide (TPR) repeat protein